MRIEINAGGLGGIAAISDFQSDFSSYIADAESMISSFKVVRNETYNLNGGVGSLAGALDEINLRIQAEETKKENAIAVQEKANDFLDLAVRVDQQVATLVDVNRDELYQAHPWLKPVVTVEEKAWYEKAWDWLCGTGEAIANTAGKAWDWLCDTGGAIADTAGKAWDWVKDTASKAWNGLVEFYSEHKKIIDTVLIVVGAIAAIAAVVATGGLALAPLLVGLGCSAGVAAAISGTIAVLAVTTTLASGTLNVIDIWCEIDDPAFNAWQKGLGWASLITNGIYSIGNIYNSLHGITNQDLKAFAKVLQTESRYGYGSNGQVVEYLSDFYPGSDAGVPHGMGTRQFYSVDNAAGGKVYVSTDPISQNDFSAIVNNSTKNVNILSGTHGDIDGLFYPESGFYVEDYMKWATNPNVNVFDVTKLSKEELNLILNSNSTNICAWCYSERSKAVLSALNLIR